MIISQVSRSGRLRDADDEASTAVVPANAGTHTPYRLFLARSQSPSFITNAAEYGSRRSPGRRVERARPMTFSLRFRAAIVSIALLAAFLGIWHIATRSTATVV